VEQTRCPSCRSHNVSVRSVQEVQNQGEIERARLPNWFRYLALVSIGFFVVGVLGALANNPIAMFATVGVIGLVFLSFIWWAQKLNIPRPIFMTRSYNGCLTCGCRWEWFPGTPARDVEMDTARTVGGTHDDAPHSA
jgi:hypothetical protein